MKKRIGVVFGSRSVEHEVSIITAVQAMNSMDAELFEVVPLYISKEGNWFTGDALKTMDVFRDLVSLPSRAQRVCLQPFAGRFALMVQRDRRSLMSHRSGLEPLSVDAVLLCSHGTNGEDGTLQGLFELLGIPYTCSGVTGSALGMDKVFQKELFAAAGIPGRSSRDL